MKKVINDNKDKERELCQSCLTLEETELWMQMMTSMLNFAMASTTLVKKIASRMDGESCSKVDNKLGTLLNEVKNHMNKMMIPKTTSICCSSQRDDAQCKTDHESLKKIEISDYCGKDKDTTELIFKKKPNSKLPIPIKKRHFKYSKELLDLISSKQKFKTSLATECLCQDAECIYDPCLCESLTDCYDKKSGQRLACSCKTREEEPKPKLKTSDCKSCCGSCNKKKKSLDSFEFDSGCITPPNTCVVKSNQLEELTGQINETEMHVTLLKEEVMRLAKIIQCEKEGKQLKKRTAAALYKEITKPQLDIEELMADPFLDSVASPTNKNKNYYAPTHSITTAFVTYNPNYQEVPFSYITKSGPIPYKNKKRNSTAVWSWQNLKNLESMDNFYSCESEEQFKW